MNKPQSPLDGKTIGISISNNTDLERLGFSESHLQHAILEFARFLLSAGATLAYGGDLRDNGLTWNLIELVESYTRDGDVSWQRIRNYLAWPLYKNLSSELKAKFLDAADFIEVPPDNDSPLAEDEPFDENKIEHRLAFGLSLSHMRLTMTEEIDARIVLGGKLQGFSGTYPGIVEEACLAIQQGIPLYVIGGFGGAAEAVAQALEGQSPAALSLDFQKQDEPYRLLAEYYGQKPEYEKAIDYPTLCKIFANCGVNGLDNGLTEDENRRLMSTIYITEMIALVLKGLGKKMSKS